MNKLTAEQRISKAKVALMGHPDFVCYSGILMLGNCTVDDDFPTAGTDGLNTIYGRKFVEALTDPQLRFVIMHEEGGHKMYRHMLTWNHLYRQGVMAVSKNDATGEEVRCNVANIAADYMVNLELHDLQKKTNNFIEMPPHALFDEKFRGMDVGQIFRQILVDNPPVGSYNGGGEGGEGGQPGDRDMRGSGQSSFDDHDWDQGAGMSPQEIAEHNMAVDAAIRQGAILAGRQAGNMTRAFTEMMEPQVRWEDQLRQFVVETCQGSDMSTFRRPNRRWLHQDIYMPTSISENLESLVIAIDTSGSIYGAVLNAFISECAAAVRAANPERVDVLYWDTRVAGHETYGKDEADKLAQTTKPKGGGGTSPSCCPVYMAKNNIKPQAVIILSDGYVGNDHGETKGYNWNAPVLWVIVDNRGFTTSTGQVIHIDSGEYR